MSGKPKVIVDPSFRKMNEIFSKADQERLYQIADVVWGKDEPMPSDAFLAALPDADAIICADWTRYGDVLPQATRLRTIFGVSGAFPYDLDYDYCFAHGIRVLSVASSFARQVAEMALGMALSLARQIADGDRKMRAGTEGWIWDGNIGAFMLYDKPVGFIGYGNIARELHPLLKPFNVPISAYDPWVSDTALRRQGVTPVDLATLLRQSRFVFVLAAPTVENRALLSREYLEMLAPDSVLILVSRAHVIDFDALTDLLLAGRFKAAVDVWPREPLDLNHPLRSCENVLMSSHRAGSVEEGLWEIGEMVLEDLELQARGLPPQRLQRAEPEMINRYASNNVPPADDAKVKKDLLS